MSLHFELPIYRKARELQNVLSGAVPNMRREAKPIAGRMLLEEAYWLGPQIRRANIAHDAEKVPQIEAILEQVEILQTMVRDAREHAHLPNSVWERCVPIFDSIGKQATSWKNKFAPAPSA